MRLMLGTGIAWLLAGVVGAQEIPASAWSHPPQILLRRDVNTEPRIEKYDSNPDHAGLRSGAPQQLASEYLSLGRLDLLEALLLDIAQTGERDASGAFDLDRCTDWLFHHLEEQFKSAPPQQSSDFSAWRKARPDSPAGPIIEAIQKNALAWSIRGGDLGSKTPEKNFAGFLEHDRAAWELLKKSRAQSSTIPSWYQFSILVGTDLDLPASELRKLFDESLSRFPGHHGTYFAMVRNLSPMWRGSFDAVDAFIREQTDSANNPEGDGLYTRLYVELNEHIGTRNLFESSKVSWPRMRSGFQKIERDLGSRRGSVTTFAVFSCLAKDADTFRGLVSRLDPVIFQMSAARGMTLESCSRMSK